MTLCAAEEDEMQGDGSGSAEREGHACGAWHAWGQTGLARRKAGTPALTGPAIPNPAIGNPTITVRRLHQI